MKTVQTLTINGETYAISDPNAATKEDVGEIEEALDSIIAIQNELIGGDSA